MEQVEYFVAPEEAANFLSITPRRVKDMARAGKIPAYPVDPTAERKEWKFRLSELAEWMLGNGNTPKKRGR